MTFTKKAICFIAVLAIFFSLSACDMPMTVVGSIPDPTETVKVFFDSVCDGDFAEADKYLSGISLSMKKQIDGVFAQKLYNYLLKSYRYGINGDVSSHLTEASCNVDFTYLDLNRLAGDLKNESTALGKKYVNAEKVASEALDTLMTQSEKYCTTKAFEITMKYSGGKWQIYLPDDLFYAICGGFETAE